MNLKIQTRKTKFLKISNKMNNKRKKKLKKNLKKKKLRKKLKKKLKKKRLKMLKIRKVILLKKRKAK